MYDYEVKTAYCHHELPSRLFLSLKDLYAALAEKQIVEFEETAAKSMAQADRFEELTKIANSFIETASAWTYASKVEKGT